MMEVLFEYGVKCLLGELGFFKLLKFNWRMHPQAQQSKLIPIPQRVCDRTNLHEVSTRKMNSQPPPKFQTSRTALRERGPVSLTGRHRHPADLFRALSIILLSFRHIITRRPEEQGSLPPFHRWRNRSKSCHSQDHNGITVEISLRLQHFFQT